MPNIVFISRNIKNYLICSNAMITLIDFPYRLAYSYCCRPKACGNCVQRKYLHMKVWCSERSCYFHQQKCDGPCLGIVLNIDRSLKLAQKIARAEYCASKLAQRNVNKISMGLEIFHSNFDSCACVSTITNNFFLSSTCCSGVVPNFNEHYLILFLF